MKYRVEWLQSVLDQLTEAWLQGNSDFRQAITLATNQIDLDLSWDPHHVGESREENERIHFVPPLAVTFEINDDKKVVTILSVRVFRRSV